MRKSWKREMKQYELFEKKSTESLYQQGLDRAANENEARKEISNRYSFLACGLAVILIFLSAAVE